MKKLRFSLLSLAVAALAGLVFALWGVFEKKD